MGIFVTSDFHLFHDNIMIYCNRFCESIENYTELMIKYLNSKIRKDDLLIYLGDLALSKKKSIEKCKQIINSINGKKIFIRGNHDAWLNDSQIKEIGFSFVCDYLVKDTILFCHYPLNGYPSLIPEYHRYLFNILKTRKITTIYHGHTHNNTSSFTENGILRINCCIDADPKSFNIVEFKI